MINCKICKKIFLLVLILNASARSNLVDMDAES